MMFRPKAGLAVSVAILCVLGLSACDPGPWRSGPSGDPSPVIDPTPSIAPTDVPPTESPSEDAWIPLGEKFISVSAIATATNGATWQLQLDTYQPYYWSSPEGRLIVDYLASVGSTSRFVTDDYAQVHNASLQVSMIKIVPISGTWPEGSGVAPQLGQGSYWTVVGMPYDGIDGGEWDSILGSGLGYGVATLEHRDRSPFLPANWAPKLATYGFTTDRLPGGSTDPSLRVTLSDCRTSIRPAGLVGDFFEPWEQVDDESGCYFGWTD